MRDHLRRDLVAAMRSRDKVAVSALRSALAALANAEAVAVEYGNGTSSPHVAGAAVGLGATEMARHQLTDGDVSTIVGREVAERLAAAALAEQHGRTDHADRARAEAAVLQRYLGDA